MLICSPSGTPVALTSGTAGESKFGVILTITADKIHSMDRLSRLDAAFGSVFHAPLDHGASLLQPPRAQGGSIGTLWLA